MPQKQREFRKSKPKSPALNRHGKRDLTRKGSRDKKPKGKKAARPEMQMESQLTKLINSGAEKQVSGKAHADGQKFKIFKPTVPVVGGEKGFA